jgi:hypothetical protein
MIKIFRPVREPKQRTGVERMENSVYGCNVAFKPTLLPQESLVGTSCEAFLHVAAGMSDDKKERAEVARVGPSNLCLGRPCRDKRRRVEANRSAFPVL